MKSFLLKNVLHFINYITLLILTILLINYFYYHEDTK